MNSYSARQSDIRNKVIAPVFKKVGLIDQWGSGLKLIADELKSYPEIAFRWHERGGLQFQVQFVDTTYKEQQELDRHFDGAIDGAIDSATKQVKKKLGILLRAILTDEGKRAPDYAAAIKIGSTRTIERYLQQLRDAQFIEFRGEAAQTGGYFIMEEWKNKLL